MVDFLPQIVIKFYKSSFLNTELKNIDIFKAQIYKLCNPVSLKLYLHFELNFNKSLNLS